MNHQLMHGDVNECMDRIPDSCIQLCVTSPPYDNIRLYGKHDWNFEQTAEDLMRVLVPGGVVCWVVADETKNGSETLTSMRQALYFVDQVGFRMHDTMIYSKLGFTHPERVRYHQTWEYVFILSRGAPRSFNPLMDRPCLTAGQRSALGEDTFTKRDGTKAVNRKMREITPDFSMRWNVWTGKTRGQERVCARLSHPAMMPEWLARDLILSWSDEGDTVIDPFVGSGTVMQCAEATGRNSIGIDIHEPYISDIEAGMGLVRV